jgi:hypothetical protein
VTTVVSPQTLDFLNLDAATSSVVTGQPYSAEGITKLTQTLADGTRIEREVRSKFYRIRRAAFDASRAFSVSIPFWVPLSSAPQMATTIFDPVAGRCRRWILPGMERAASWF